MVMPLFEVWVRVKNWFGRVRGHKDMEMEYGEVWSQMSFDDFWALMREGNDAESEVSVEADDGDEIPGTPPTWECNEGFWYEG